MKSVFISILFLLTALAGNACDYCGLYLGPLPNLYGHRLEVLYRYRLYNGYVNVGGPNGYNQPHQWTRPSPLQFRTAHDPSQHTPNPTYDLNDKNWFHTTELRGTFFLAKRFSLLATLPIVANGYQFQGARVTRQGIGDVTVMGNWFAFRKDEGRMAYAVQLHGGLKAPTGEYVRNGEAFAAASHFQPGTGSFDFIGGTSLMVRRGTWGATLNALYKYNLANPLDYRFLPSFNSTGVIFYDHYVCDDKTEYHIIPQVGAYYENSNGEEFHGKWMPGTGGQLWFATAGLAWNNKRVGLSFLYQQPFWQDLLGTQLGCTGRMTFNAYLMLPQRRRG